MVFRLHTAWVLVTVCVTVCTCYKHYQLQIPNGEMVPHPCKANHLWKGVGHENFMGGGKRNVFGNDFMKNGRVWSPELCNKDSDGDGMTNGEELGDPDCTWSAGGLPPKRTLGLSHPGVCDPFGSSKCQNKSAFVDCEKLNFECPVLEEEETFNVTVRMPRQPVPDTETTYRCMNFEVPTDQPYHLVATQPVIDNEDIMHHIVVYGCSKTAPRDFNTPYDCLMGPDSECGDTIALWTVGVSGQCFHRNAGFLIGGTSGYKHIAMQFHWNNPQNVNTYTDNSGIVLHMTNKLRAYNAGILSIGQVDLVIPPGKSRHVATSTCNSECTPSILNDEITITSAVNHMHYLGASQITVLQRDGEPDVDLARDNEYSYDSPVEYIYKEGIVVKPGDELKTTCIYQSTSRSTTTFYGDSTAAEMCFSFFTFYPKENANKPDCSSWASISPCDWDDGVIQGCEMAIYFNRNHTDMIEIHTKVEAYCTPGTCRVECKEYLRELKMQPCYRGEVGRILRDISMRYASSDKTDLINWHALLDSCNWELAEEATLLRISNKVCETSSVSNLVPGCLATMLILLKTAMF